MAEEDGRKADGSHSQGGRAGPAHGSARCRGSACWCGRPARAPGCCATSSTAGAATWGSAHIPRSRSPWRARRRWRPGGIVKAEARSAGRARSGQGADLQGGGRGADREQAAGLAQRQARGAVGRDAEDLRLPEARRSRRAGDRHRGRARRAAADLGEKPETASRVRQRIEAVLGLRHGARARARATTRRGGRAISTICCPSRARSGRSSTMPRSTGAKRRHSWPSWPSREGIAAKALAFAILTAARSGEVRGMTWGEIDDADSVWTVPAGRIKAGKEHRVPLTPAARALLGERGAARRRWCSRRPSDPAKPLSRHDADRRAAPHGPRRPDGARLPRRPSATGPARRRRTRAR